MIFKSAVGFFILYSAILSGLTYLATHETFNFYGTTAGWILLIPVILCSFFSAHLLYSRHIISLGHGVQAKVLATEGRERTHRGMGTEFYFMVDVSYAFRGQDYTRRFTSPEDFKIGELIELFVDPKDPRKLAMKGRNISSAGSIQP